MDKENIYKQYSRSKIQFPEILLAIAIEPSFVAGKDEREPRKLPIGVLAMPTMHTSEFNS